MKNKNAVKWIAKNTKKEAFKLVVLILLNAVFSVMSVLFALAMKTVLEGARLSNKPLIVNGAIYLGVIILLQFIFRILINGLTEHVEAKINWHLRANLFSKILNKKYEKISGYHSGELLNRLTNDVPVVAKGVTGILPVLVGAVARLLSAVVALIILDWIFAVAFTVAGILVFLVIILMRTKLKALHKGIQATEGRSRSFMQECIENLLAVKVFSVNDKINAKSNRLIKDNFDVTMKRRNRAVLGNATYNFIFSAGYFFALVYGAVKIFSGSLFYSDLLAILQLVNNVQVPFASISGVIPSYYSMVASAERIIEICDVEEEELLENFNESEVYENLKSINLSDVTFAYDKENVLARASAVIEKGDFAVVTGSSGTGKSTLIKLLLGVYKVDGGELYLDAGKKILLNENTRALFSYVPQGNMLFSGTIKDNVTFAWPTATDEDVDFALKTACAKEFIDELPDGLNTVVGEKGSGLSEGQVQRLAISRALLTGAPIIILDESTSALDEKTEETLLANLKELKDKTFIIVSHKKAPLSICNKRLNVENGEITEISLN